MGWCGPQPVGRGLGPLTPVDQVSSGKAGGRGVISPPGDASRRGGFDLGVKCCSAGKSLLYVPVTRKVITKIEKVRDV